MRIRKSKRSSPEIPTAALSDIALLLLIFFIVTTEFLVQRTMTAELPAISDDQEEATEDLITVKVAEDVVFLNEQPIEDMLELSHQIAARIAGKTEPQDRAVIVDGRAEVRYERVVRAIDAIKRAGAIPTIMEIEE